MNVPPKVAHIVISLQHGGLEQCALQWCQERNRIYPGSTVIVCLNEPGPLSEGIHDVSVFSLNANRSQFPWDRSAVKRLRDIIAVRGIDVLHSHNTAARQYACLARVNGHPRHIYTDHGTNLYLLGIVNRMRLAFMKRRTDAVVAVSTEAAERLASAEQIPRSAITVIMNGIAIDSPYRRAGETVREKAGVPEGTFIMGYVGRLSHEKGVDRLIKAFAAVAHATPQPGTARNMKCSARLHLAARPTGGNTHSVLRTAGEVQPRATPQPLALLLIGDGPVREELESLANRLGVSEQVSFLGAQPNARALMSGLDLFVLPSRSEGLPLVLLEAMVESVSIAATNRGQCASVLGDGKFGAILPDDDAEWPPLLADAIHAVTSGQTRETCEAAREHIKSHYSIDATISQYEELYNQM